MNRRKAIKGILAAVAGGGLVVTGYEGYELIKQPDLPYLDRNKPLIGALAATIIPPTPGAPGAGEPGMADFMVLLLKECTHRTTLNTFIYGLKEVAGYSQKNYGRPFQECNEEERIAILTHFEQRTINIPGLLGKAKRRYLGNSFFYTLKRYAVEAYCTSEPGATKGLSYVPVPGNYHGCIPVMSGQRAWATK